MTKPEPTAATPTEAGERAGSGRAESRLGTLNLEPGTGNRDFVAGLQAIPHELYEAAEPGTGNE